MRYRVDYKCNGIKFDYDGEEIEMTTRHARYFNSYHEKEQFLQDLDMTGEGWVTGESEISDAKSNFYYALAFILYMFGGGYFDTTRKLFYKLMGKTLRPLGNDMLCIKFDECIGTKRLGLH